MKLNRLFEVKYGNDIILSQRNLTSLPTDLPDRVSGNFHCYSNKLTSLEFCPSHIGGNFLCNENELTSLEHCPSQIGGNFHCHGNKLTSLEFCPSQVGGDFYCGYNQLTSLKFCPSQVGGNFSCSHNKLTSLKDVHTHIKKVDGGFRCVHNHTESHILGLMLIEIGREIVTRLGDGKDVDKILNKWKNQGRKGVLGAQRELLELGYAELAQL